MRELILVKYAPEIFLKGLNRGKFERKLRDNIAKKLDGIKAEFIHDSGRYFIKTDEIEESINRISKVFGILEVCLVREVDIDFNSIQEVALEKVRQSEGNTFKIITNRANKKFELNSMEVSRKVGAYVLTNLDGEINVDVKNPDILINIEIRNNYAYVWANTDITKGAAGLPYGMNGSTMLMLSGGIDSPVAGYMMAKRGVEVSCVYYHSHPYTSERAKDKVKDLAKILAQYTEKINLYIVPFTDIQMEIINKCREDELTIIMRRFMMRIACRLADKYGINSVSTGESIGQVASQTMDGLIVSDNCADRPAFRPLIAMDKTDIMEIARKIGTYETSILPYEDCCTIFVPKHPKTNPKLDAIMKEEEKLNVDELVQKSIENIEVVTF
ncbi:MULTISPECIES: tRNA uracil 4-sulfurtransferase ThiI [Clostridium]|jgi:thiazole biosynthesis/tRNA modification protein ThiI|uniref:Probable tRNA sulfurtransferase n=3 Tax=Clostridium beijerinckii TaxID=1520 RepID=A0AAE2RU36_CLOBE|nr:MULTISPECIES: tRNA uracil 4-sulfurtransferase ThiI [Clostridium]ABR33493.1 thiamine biosynthesis/tRNA modification protein ThiI [Clostridium beijerinckii NCIMB 8052]AIU04052.1 thiamine biosynthesis protein ThiI [Clostridium beijerinckii ATCC 35702]AVK50364.1 thiamine biosynthesis protein ThiI [Clostridium sp. MF28]MBF7811607.1 tRNA 4-thiouridine(8) synthase ThiI [Clostridium beijerinckii]NRT25247.1 thiamine biosynthesis protein ThiI [Clostridium beijerinckii]